MTALDLKRRQYWLAGNREPGQDLFFLEALDKTIWQPGTKENWDTCWYTGMPDGDVFEKLEATKSINHIPGNNGLTVKNYLYETLSNAQSRLAGKVAQARMDYFPQVYSMPEDYHKLQQCAAQNPGKKWILKPKNLSRGRGIKVVQDIADIPLKPKWMVQAYIDNPHVMNERKYVLRLYVLVTSVEPLRVYLHREGFAKLASEPYNIKDPHNPFSHLTNPDINATNTDSDAPVVFVGLTEYRQWLRDGGHDDVALFAKIHDLVTLTVIAVREHMRKRVAEVDASTRGCYELLGVDCLVDEQLKPWILECNLSPSLEVCAGPEDGGDTETRIKRAMITDMVSLLGLNAPQTSREGLGLAQSIRLDIDEEQSRAGDFLRLFPAKESAEEYLSAFPVPRYADIVSATHVIGKAPAPMRLSANQTTEIISEEELALYFEKTHTLYTPNQIAGWIWLKTVDGETPDDIVQALLENHEAAHGPASADEKWKISENVWDVLSNWAQLGLLRREDEALTEDEVATPVQQASALEVPAVGWPSHSTIKIGERSVTLAYGCAAVATRLAPIFAPLQTNETSTLTIAVQQGHIGYALAIGPHLLATGLGLDNLAQSLSRALFERSPAKADEIAINGALVPISDEDAIFCVAPHQSAWEEALAIALAGHTKKGIIGGVRLDLNQPNTVFPIGLPLRLNKDDADLGPAADLAVPAHIQNWSNGAQGHLLASDLGSGAQSYRLRAIVLPERLNSGQAKLDKVSVHRALGALLVSAVADQQVGLSGDQVLALSEWLEVCDMQSLPFSDPKAAAVQLAEAYGLNG